MTTRTQHEQRAEYKHVMGPKLGPLYESLWQYTARLYSMWDEYKTLFGHSSERYDFLMGMAPDFFKVVVDSLWADLLLHVSKLTGPVITATRRNVTFRALPQLVADSTLRAQVEAAVDAAVAAAAFAKLPRDRWIAHLDHELVFSPGPVPVTLGSRLQMSQALEAMTAALDSVAVPFGFYRNHLDTGPMFDGAETLVRLLEIAKKTIDDQERAIGLGGAGGG